MKTHHRMSKLEYDIYSANFPKQDEFQEAVGRQIRDVSKSPQKRYDLLEIGVGTGETTKTIHLGNHVKITGIDIEIDMLKIAEKKLKYSSSNIELINEDALEYMFATKKKYDAVYSASVLHNFEQDIRIVWLSTINNKLKFGGIFVNGDKYALEDPKDHYRALNFEMELFLSMYKDHPKIAYDWAKHYIDDEKIRWDHPIEDFEETGFKNVRKTYQAVYKGMPLLREVIVGEK